MQKKEKIVLLIILIFIGFFLFLIYGNKETKDSFFQIYFFDAGKADSMLIKEGDSVLLIDTGEEDLSSTILSYLKGHNIFQIDALILTHFDKDHVGSASSILREVEVKEVYQSNYPKESDEYSSYLLALEEEGITPITVEGDFTFSIGNMEIAINGPDKLYSNNESNNSSLITSITYQNQKYLFMGDAQNDRMEDYLESHSETYDFLKVPYHGFYQKELIDLLKVTSPKYAVITCSDTEGGEEKTLSLLESYSVSTYLTRNGNITLSSNGKEIQMKQ